MQTNNNGTKRSLVKEHASNLFRAHTYNIFSNYHALGGAAWGLLWGGTCAALTYFANFDIPQEAYAGIVAAGPALMIPAFGALGSIQKDSDKDNSVLEQILKQKNDSAIRVRDEEIELSRLERKPLLDMFAKIYERSTEHKAGHYARVVKYCKLLAKRHNLSREETADLCTAAKFCDIGELLVNKDIWTKKTKLMPDEIKQITMHPVHSEKFLKRLDVFNDSVLRLVRSHHECYDGSGYPDRKAGRYASVEVESSDLRLTDAESILAIVDSYVAMTEKRPHKKRVLSPKDAMKELSKNRGSQFDPTCVDYLVNILEEEFAQASTTDNYQTKKFRTPAPPIVERPKTNKFLVPKSNETKVPTSECAPVAGSTRKFARPSKQFKPNSDLDDVPLGKPMTRKYKKLTEDETEDEKPERPTSADRRVSDLEQAYYDISKSPTRPARRFEETPAVFVDNADDAVSGDALKQIKKK